MRILLIDDHDSFARGMILLLEREGHEVEWARSGEEARCADGGFDLLISDLFLLDQEGVRLLQRLRARFPGPAISCSALADGESVSQAAGFALHLSKPFDIQRLRALLERMSRLIARTPVRREERGQPAELFDPVEARKSARKMIDSAKQMRREAQAFIDSARKMSRGCRPADSGVS